MPLLLDAVTTIDELLALPEDGMRHELLDGVHVVTPAPVLPHQAVLLKFLGPMLFALNGHETLVVMTSPADIVLSPRTLVQPDVFVIRKAAGAKLRKWAEVGVPALAIELLSPTTASRDRGVKRRIYQAAGVDEYWIVDLDARLVERWRPRDERPEIVDHTLVWAPAELMAPLALELPPLFASVLD